MIHVPHRWKSRHSAGSTLLSFNGDHVDEEGESFDNWLEHVDGACRWEVRMKRERILTIGLNGTCRWEVRMKRERILTIGLNMSMAHAGGKLVHVAPCLRQPQGFTVYPHHNNGPVMRSWLKPFVSVSLLSTFSQFIAVSSITAGNVQLRA